MCILSPKANNLQCYLIVTGRLQPFGSALERCMHVGTKLPTWFVPPGRGGKGRNRISNQPGQAPLRCFAMHFATCMCGCSGMMWPKHVSSRPLHWLTARAVRDGGDQRFISSDWTYAEQSQDSSCSLESPSLCC